ncbi:apoptosis-associated speck-like protein containing a CARD [Oncorhynchus clarkii lewisi]|uniref:apoptosis-associated speck-like protein containing a CARD n=1 Tax=Oncorhynchus clarkii lewisi TaxID=490388 RepID=UPI0039B83979
MTVYLFLSFLIWKMNQNDLAEKLEIRERSSTLDVPALLLTTLKELTEEQLKIFQSNLTTVQLLGFPPIPKSQLENTDRQVTVDQMMKRYGPERAVKITLVNLKWMNRKLAEKKREALLLATLEELSTDNPPANPSAPPGRAFIRRHRMALETRLGLLQPIFLRLQDHGVLIHEEREEVDSKSTKTLQNQALLDMVVRKGSRAQEHFYQVLKEVDPCLVEDLEEQTV